MAKNEELIGKRFGRLTVVERAEDRITPSGNKQRQWICKCDCGNETTVITSRLKNGHTKSCGCFANDIIKRHIDLSGKKFGRLSVIKHLDISERKCKDKAWRCRCDCGKIKDFSTNNLTSGKVLSCGCYNAEKSAERGRNKLTTHGMTNTRLFHIWSSMLQRCNNPKSQSYEDYGARGITVCQDWLDDFMNFYNWATNNGYTEELTIDRIDVNKGYCPENCRWATYTVQANNKRTTKRIIINGVPKTVREISDEYGILYNTVSTRYQKYRKGLCEIEDIIKPVEK